jgi:beta-lactamase class A
MKLSIVTLTLILFGAVSCTKSSSITSQQNPPSAQTTPKTQDQTDIEKALEKRLTEICARAEGSVGVAVIHVESGRTVSINGNAALPLYSVVKLPIAITVFKDAEANRLKLDQAIHVTPAETVPGTPENTALWQTPVDRPVTQLMEFSIARSDNTSTDKLLELISGPSRVTEQMRALGFQSFAVHSTVKEYIKTRQPNTGSASDLANLLKQLQEGKILQPANTEALISYMRRAITGLRRLRGDLPPGTIVADKTGSGERSNQTNTVRATNDVGLITLPEGKGTLAVAVLLSGSRLPDAAQEKLIAELARAAYDAYTKT